MKKSFIYVFLPFLSAISLLADIPLPQPTAKTSKGSPFEVGMRFQGISGDQNITKKTKRKASEILEEMLKVQKKQLKVQNKILKILEDQFDPQPKKITVNGKECIENSSADCFNMPLLHPDAKKVPVLKEFVSNPTVENAKNYLQWHAKFLKSAYRGGEALTLAVNKYGPTAYPMNYERFDYDTPGAYSSVLKTRNDKMVLNALSEKIELYLFFGKNADADAYAYDNYAKAIDELPKIKYNIIFYSEGSKETFIALASRLKNIKKFKDSAKSISVSKQAFQNHTVYATPMINMHIKEQNKMRTILVGRNSADGIIEEAIDVLEYDKVLNGAHSPGFKKWERTGNYSDSYYKDIYGVDLNSTYLKNKYKGDE